MKTPTSCVPQNVMHELGVAMLEGALKYGRHNWRESGVHYSTYYDACRRHLDAWWEGENTDPESGLPHVIKAMACLVVIRDAQWAEKATDDRPPAVDKGWQEGLATFVEALYERHPEPKDPVTELLTKEPS